MDLSFGALLCSARIRAGLTQEQLAERAGLSARAISDLERLPHRIPRPSTLELVCAALSCTDAERDVLLRSGTRPPRKHPHQRRRRVRGLTVSGPAPRGSVSLTVSPLPVGEDAPLTALLAGGVGDHNHTPP